MKILITGASGFLGGFLLDAAQHHQVLGIVNTNKIVHSHAALMQLNLTDRDVLYPVLKEWQPQCIIHAAAHSNIDACEKDPQMAEAINVNSTHFLAEWAQQYHARLIFVSSDMVFDGENGPYTESAPTSPLSVYGKTKVQSEQIVLGIENSVVVRSALEFGLPAHGGSSFLVWMQHRLEKRECVPLYTDQFRSPVWGRNLAEMIVELVNHDFSGILNGGGANRIDRLTFGKQVCDIAGFDAGLLSPASMKDAQASAPRPRDVSLDMGLAGEILKTPVLTTEHALKNIY